MNKIIIDFIKRIEYSDLINSLGDLYIEFPFRCHDVNPILYKIISDNTFLLDSDMKLIKGSYNLNDTLTLMSHTWIKCDEFIIDATAIQFVSPKTELFKECSNFREYFLRKGGIMNTILLDVGGLIIYKDNVIFNNYCNIPGYNEDCINNNY